MIGDVYVKKGEAQPAFDAYVVCSDAYIRLGQLEKASLVQSKIARLAPDSLDPASQKKQAIFLKQVEGDKAFEAGDVEAAAAAYQAVLELDPDRFDLYQKLGDLYLRKGQTEEACKKYLEIGDIYFRNKLIKKAAPIYLKVVELDPENLPAHAALADIHVKSGNESEAKRELLQLSELLFLRGDYDRCYEFAQKAEALKNIESYNYLGHVELRRGRASEAKAWFEKLLKFKLNHGGAVWGMGLIALKEGKKEEAFKQFEKVPKTDRFYAEARADLAALLEEQGKTAEAAATWKEAATQLRDKGLTEKAKEAAERAGKLDAGAPAAEAPAPEPAAPAPEPEPVAPAAAVQAPSPAPPPLPPVASPPAVSAPPPLPVVKAAAPPPPPPEPEASPVPAEDADTLLGLASNFEAEGALDEAIGIYQRVLALFPDNGDAKDALARVYGQLARGAMGGAEAANKQAEAEAIKVAEQAHTEELNHLAAQRAQMERDRAKAEEEAKKQAEELARIEAEAKRLADERAKAEAEMKRMVAEKTAMEQAAKDRAESEAKRRAEEEAKLRIEIEARQRAEIESKRQAEEANRQAEEMKRRLEAEIRVQLEAEMRKRLEDEARKRADEEVALKVLEARREAESQARASAEAEIRRQFDIERKKLENEKAEVKRQLEDELRQRISLEVERKESEEARRKVEAVRQHSETEARKKIQSDVLARVQAQQKEKLAPLQRTIEEIRRKVEEQQAAQGALAAEAGAPAAKPKPAPEPEAAAEDANDDMDDFMTSAVADIYVKQGLVKEAARIYERILKREPHNRDVQAKLAALTGGPAPAKDATKDDGKGPDAGAPAKKSKVSYL